MGHTYKGKQSMDFYISWNDWNNPPEGTVVIEDLSVVGTRHDNRDGTSRQAAFSKLKKWAVVNAVREPNNPYDPNAIAIISEHGQIGYIASEEAEKLSQMIDKGHKPLAKLSGLFSCPDDTLGGKIELHLLPSNTSSV
jgi:hypothetical protein